MYVYIENMFQTHCVFVFDQTTRPQLDGLLPFRWQPPVLSVSKQKLLVSTNMILDSRFFF